MWPPFRHLPIPALEGVSLPHTSWNASIVLLCLLLEHRDITMKYLCFYWLEHSNTLYMIGKGRDISERLTNHNRAGQPQWMDGWLNNQFLTLINLSFSTLYNPFCPHSWLLDLYCVCSLMSFLKCVRPTHLLNLRVTSLVKQLEKHMRGKSVFPCNVWGTDLIEILLFLKSVLMKRVDFNSLSVIWVHETLKLSLCNRGRAHGLKFSCSTDQICPLTQMYQTAKTPQIQLKNTIQFAVNKKVQYKDLHPRVWYLSISDTFTNNTLTSKNNNLLWIHLHQECYLKWYPAYTNWLNEHRQLLLGGGSKQAKSKYYSPPLTRALYRHWKESDKGRQEVERSELYIHTPTNSFCRPYPSVDFQVGGEMPVFSSGLQALCQLYIE